MVIGVGKKEGSSLGTSLDKLDHFCRSPRIERIFGSQTDSLRITVRAGSAAKNSGFG